jgi:hypothetical protein
MAKKKTMPGTRTPTPITVKEDKDSFIPRTVVLGGESLAADTIDERSEVEDQWWEDAPVAYMNYAVTLEGGREMSLSRDMQDGRWFREG